jgi:hypothetical protein
MSLADLVTESMIYQEPVRRLTAKPSPHLSDEVRARGHEVRRANAGFVQPLSAKWLTIMSLQMRGHTAEAIAVQMGTSKATISAITRTEKYRNALHERLAKYDDDLLALKPLAIDALSRGLNDLDGNVALRASDQFFRVTGQGAPSSQGGPVSAVEVAKALIAQHVEVHIHQGGGGSEVLHYKGPADGPRLHNAVGATLDHDGGELPEAPGRLLDQPGRDEGGGAEP